MGIQREHAEALLAIATSGSLQGAARQLGKSPSALVYTMKTLEDDAGLALFDRSGYRTTLTDAGEQVARLAREMITAAQNTDALCSRLATGAMPRFRLVFDGIFNHQPIINALESINRETPVTAIAIYKEYLGGVEERFASATCDVMLTLLPALDTNLVAVDLPPLAATLVTGKSHDLARHRRIPMETLRQHTFLSVHGSDTRLAMPTGELESQSTVHLSDFESKCKAIKSGLGFGWMPSYMIEEDLSSGSLVAVDWVGPSEHVFRPRLYRRRGSAFEQVAQHIEGSVKEFLQATRRKPGN